MRIVFDKDLTTKHEVAVEVPCTCFKLESGQLRRFWCRGIYG